MKHEEIKELLNNTEFHCSMCAVRSLREKDKFDVALAINPGFGYKV